MRRLLRLPAVAVLLLSVAAGVLATTWLLDDRALDAGGSVTEGVVTDVRERVGRDEVVVSLDLRDGRTLLTGALVVAVLTAAVAPWRRRQA